MHTYGIIKIKRLLFLNYIFFTFFDILKLYGLLFKLLKTSQKKISIQVGPPFIRVIYISFIHYIKIILYNILAQFLFVWHYGAQ